MKKIIIPIIVAALSLVSCQKEAAVVAENGTSKVTFKAVPEMTTKTAFSTLTDGKYPVVWSGTETVAVSYNAKAGMPYKSEAVTASSDKKTATFVVNIEEDGDASYNNFYAIAPGEAFLSTQETNGFQVQLPSAQTPVAGSCDEAAQILYAEHLSETFDSEVTFSFKHIMAYGNLSITMPNGVSGLKSITLTADSDLAGRAYYKDGVVTPQSASKSLTITTSNAQNNFFSCFPVDLSGKSLKVTIAAGTNTYTKNVSLSNKTLKFEAGKVSKFSVDMSSVKADTKVTYTLVTDPSTLKVGDKVIIAAADHDMAISTTQNSNNRAATAVTKTGNTIINPGDAVQIFTLEKGTKANTCVFNAGELGSLYASSSSSNQMKTSTTVNDNSSFAITIADGKASVVAQGNNTRSYMRYNESNTAFACYAESSSVTELVAIYTDGKGSGSIMDGGSDTPSTPTYASLAELVAAGAPTSAGSAVNVTLTNEEIKSFYTSTSSSTGETFRNGIFLEAGGKSIEIYCKNVPDSWEVGGTVSATLTEVTWKIYKDTWELVPANWDAFTYKAPSSGGSDTPAGAITLTANDGFKSAYGTETTITVGGVDFSVNAGCAYNQKGSPSGWAVKQIIQMRNSSKGAGELANTTSLGAVKSVKLYLVNGNNECTLSYGSSASSLSSSIECTTLTGVDQTVSYTDSVGNEGASATAKVYTFDLSSAKPSFIKLTNGSKALYIYKIEIER